MSDRLRMLLVDDEESILVAMTDYLQSYEWVVDSARDFETARTLVAQNRYTVVIADLRLSPREPMAGLDLITHVREVSPDTRTILLTAYGSSQVEDEALSLGVDAFLQKPKPLGELVRIVFEVLGVEPGALTQTDARDAKT